MTIRTLATIAAAAAALSAAPAFASHPEAGLRIVRTADLDLSSPAGVKTLHHRIAQALEAVCGSYAGTETSGAFSENRDISHCRAVAQAEADQRIAALKVTNTRMASLR